MSSIPQLFQTAVTHHQTGNLQLAEPLYRQVLQADPRHVDALHLLGVLCCQAGRSDLGSKYISEAVRLKPDFADAHSNLGNAYLDQGKAAEAVASYQNALRLRPNFAVGHNNLGNAYLKQGKPAEAVVSYQNALRLQPDFAVAHNNLANAYQEQNKLAEAVASYQNALRLQPNYVEALSNLGNAYRRMGNLEQALTSCLEAIRQKPDFADAHCNLGNVVFDQGKLAEAVASYQHALRLKPNYAEAHNNLANAYREQGHLADAVASYQQALQLQPSYAEAHSNLGNVYRQLGKLEQAIASGLEAVRRKPDFADAHCNLGAAYLTQGKLTEAVASYQQAIRLQPDLVRAHFNLGSLYQEVGNLEEAVGCFRRVLELKPDDTMARGYLLHSRQHLCCWDDLKALSRQVIDVVAHDAEGSKDPLVHPFCFLAMPVTTTAAQQLHCSTRHVERCLPVKTTPALKLVRQRNSPRQSKISIGYLSADFHAHATALLIAELFEKHDHERFAISGYSYGKDDRSPIRQRLIQAFDRFVDVRDLSFADAAQRIAVDEVDILVDLKGYTARARTDILVFRPAPIQVNYLGFPGTMGASFMDYILVDDYIVPLDQQPFFTEKLVHLPGCYQVNDSHREIAAHTPSRAECGLPEQGFVFCSFNNNYKMTPDMFDIWMALLKAVPGSVLWLYVGNRFASANLCREAETRGVSADRLVFAPRQPLPEHLARHRLADLFLDTFPVTAHTTASDALWAGCPVLTLAGETFVSRVAGSLLRTLGLPELITTSIEEYQAQALHLARNADALAQLRARLEANRKSSSLFNAELFARNLESAYETMWRMHTSGESPRNFSVSPR